MVEAPKETKTGKFFRALRLCSILVSVQFGCIGFYEIFCLTLADERNVSALSPVQVEKQADNGSRSSSSSSSSSDSGSSSSGTVIRF